MTVTTARMKRLKATNYAEPRCHYCDEPAIGTGQIAANSWVPVCTIHAMSMNVWDTAPKPERPAILTVRTAEPPPAFHSCGGGEGSMCSCISDHIDAMQDWRKRTA